ncbi:amidohydrolase family protein [Fulvivirgaceae bacterium PWU5]|uniref:Amidohydrolase family protein n=1 Tax=Dawidia cretensis TaxID=2782350 RepID=A0AAP2GRA4_9BACT|nr:amidohydrolase family protein [Dawidia cretensis]MBT1710144.1 amidohydrolase family protein [Dawidia cretensis]
MQKYLFCSLLLFGCIAAVAQPSDTDRFIIHRHLKVIGRETYHLNRMADGGRHYSVDCFYADRGKDVPLKATIRLSASGDPLEMTSRGYTSRMSQINDAVVIRGDSLLITQDSTTKLVAKPANMFPVDGYAPAIIQELLVAWWMKNSKPANVQALFGPVEIRTLATDTLRHANGDRILSAIGINNVIWGWEFLWIDQRGQLAALTTINAEGDKFEFVRPDYENDLLFFAAKSAEYGARLYSAKSKENSAIAIIHGVLVDVEKEKKLHDAAIIVVDGKISWLGPTQKAVIPANATIIDAKQRHMLPGLWDMHAHMKQVEWGPAYIATGITTVRDMGNEFVFINSMKSTIDAGQGVGPNILKAGIIDGPGPMSNGIMIAETKEQGIALVKKYKQAGFHQVKLYSQLKPDVVQAICVEAHRAGMTVAGHIPQGMTTEQTVDLGIDMIAHLPYLMRAFVGNANGDVDLKHPDNRKMLKKLLEKKIVVDPTLALFELVYRPLDQPLNRIEPAFQTLPAKLQADFTSMGLPPAEAEKKIPAQKVYQKLVFQLHQAGIPIVAGTDMLIPGYTLYRELELYVAAGLTTWEALQCATITPARVMGLSTTTGTLEKGKDADIILVDGDPVSNISDIRRVSLVLTRGRLYNPSEVHQTIGFGR